MTNYHIVKASLTARANTERGANLVEYALLLALIAIVCVGAVSALGGTTSEPLSEIGSAVKN